MSLRIVRHVFVLRLLEIVSRLSAQNRKLLIFPIEELPQMSKGKGVILQKYKDGKLADAKTFEYANGLSWHLKGGRQRIETELLAWKGKRASAGRMPPTGFPKPPKFT